MFDLHDVTPSLIHWQIRGIKEADQKLERMKLIECVVISPFALFPPKQNQTQQPAVVTMVM